MAITLLGERCGELPAKIAFLADRGAQYPSAQITAFAKANGITRSTKPELWQRRWSGP